MSDSDSDYDVEAFIKPDTIRRTYNNEDVISDKEADSGESGEEENAEKSDESEPEIEKSQCKVTNGFKESDAREPVKSRPEPEKSNSRYILYVTNLSSETTRTMLEDFFGDAGAIKSIRIPRVRLGCYAFVEMKDIDGYKSGLKSNNRELDGRKIQVYEGSKNKKHTSTKNKNLKRKTRQQHMTNMKLKKKNDE